ncbi:FecCD family ABC transporter permease [Jannaschia sp. CCS1]|uniref:FecCD family ABC transporter permease n=1 Tax=Jannaschia sp. (strain CCS1) TaxID=290400 RepID=UPI00006C0027|nr:iron ABC transporter permease [Jannaschia sp. CCS1]ABD55040.1 transport system permease protein [Jannaschia sp. CCS1]
MRAGNTILIAGAICLAVLSLHLGVRTYAPAEIWRALTSADADATAIIVRDLRVPRMVLAALIGAALALSGLMMQSVTRNPVAEPGLLGVNAGAAFAVVVLLTVQPGAGVWLVIGVAAMGAALAAALVFGLALSIGAAMSPVHLLLAGVTVAALLMAGVQVLIILNEQTLEELIFWLSGSFADRPIVGISVVAAGLGLGGGLCLFQAPALDALGADDATATGLGVDVPRLRLLLLGCAALLAGCAVALAGPIAFVGLVAPRLARLSGARGHAQLIPRAVLFGVLLALSADLIARFVLYPSEAPVSAVMALIGVPILIGLLRGTRMRLA